LSSLSTTLGHLMPRQPRQRGSSGFGQPLTGRGNLASKSTEGDRDGGWSSDLRREGRDDQADDRSEGGIEMTGKVNDTLRQA
jgi:hypothetical protein